MVSFICIHSVICKLEVWASSLQEAMERNRSDESSCAGVCFLWLQNALGKGKLSWRWCFLTCSQLTWIPPALTTRKEVWFKEFPVISFQRVKSEEGWKEVPQGIACSPCCWIIPVLFPASLLLPRFQPPWYEAVLLQAVIYYTTQMWFLLRNKGTSYTDPLGEGKE